MSVAQRLNTECCREHQFTTVTLRCSICGAGAPQIEPRRATARQYLGRTSFEALSTVLRTALLAPQDDGMDIAIAERSWIASAFAQASADKSLRSQLSMFNNSLIGSRWSW
ncbi:hypothetical protein AB7M17_007244 [Bradyrhizobium sp. USDA 377]